MGAESYAQGCNDLSQKKQLDWKDKLGEQCDSMSPNACVPKWVLIDT